MSLRWCRGCNLKHFESERHKWTSGNSEIDDFILETQITAEFSDQALEWIPETQLTEFKLIGKGGFGKEGRAYNVEKGEEGVKEFLEEIKAMHQYRLWSLTIDFRSLHRSGLVHRDLHSGNVLFGDNRRNFVADLGLACKDGQNITGEIKASTAREMAEIFKEWTQILSKDKLNEEEKSIKDQFVSSDLERQRSSRPAITFRELSTRPLTSCRLPTVSLSNQDLHF
ncbi:unnamed protein product [Rhizophagus irregularis]|nr:unnamed protein product [Rhizophagus irregularis]